MATLTMKERYARINLSSLPEDYQKEFKTIQESTENFSDDDLIGVFQENFDDLYNLVETRYSGAIKTGGTVKKERPAKIKKVGKKKHAEEFTHPKTEEEFKEPAKIEKELGRERKKLSASDIEFIEDQLTNNEEATDEELITHFVIQLRISEAQAKKWVAKRDKYLKAPVEKRIKYSERTKLKKESRSEKETVATRDGVSVKRKDPLNRGKVFYDENGKKWTCKGYNAKLDECVFKDEDGKEITSCLRDMYKNNPVEKRGKGDLVDDCKQTLKEAGYTVQVHKAGQKKIERKKPRPEKAIIKERVDDAFTPITKDLENSDEKKVENKELIEVLDSIKGLFTKFMNRISNIADDGDIKKMRKIEKLLKEIVE